MLAVTTTLLGKVSEAFARKETSHEAAYRDLVAKCGRGEEVDPDKVLALLTKWGKDVEDFQTEVVEYAKRLELRALAEQLPEHDRRIAELTNELDAAGQKHADTVHQIRTWWEGVFERCEPQMKAAMRAKAEAERAAFTLQQYNLEHDRELIERRKAAEQKKQRAFAEVCKLEREIKDCERMLPVHQKNLDRVLRDPPRSTSPGPTMPGQPPMCGGPVIQSVIENARGPVETCENALISGRKRAEEARAVQREAEAELREIEREAATRVI